jgi:LuxR family maltose regulon positive regulatory protein
VCTESLAAAGHHADVLGCTIALADIRITQGRLGDAMAAYEAALARSAQYGSPTLRGAADMHVGIADLLRERNDLAGALTRLQASADLGERYGLPQNPYRSRVVHARILQAQGDLDGALELLDQAERLYAGDSTPTCLVAAWRRGCGWLRELGEAQQWVRSRDWRPTTNRATCEVRAHHAGQGAARRGTAAATADAVGLLERLLVRRGRWPPNDRCSSCWRALAGHRAM